MPASTLLMPPLQLATMKIIPEILCYSKGFRDDDCSDPLIFGEALRTGTDLKDAIAKNRDLQVLAAGFMNHRAMIKKMGSVPGVSTAPPSIIAAEKRGSHQWNNNPLPIPWRTGG